MESMIFIAIVVAIIIIRKIQKDKRRKEEEEQRRREFKAKQQKEREYKELESSVLKELGISSWSIAPYFDAYETVKSRQALEKYDSTKFFKENQRKLEQAENTIKNKSEIAAKLRRFLVNNKYDSRSQYYRLVNQIQGVIKNAAAYRIKVAYISSAGNNLARKEIIVNQDQITAETLLILNRTSCLR